MRHMSTSIVFRVVFADHSVYVHKSPSRPLCNSHNISDLYPLSSGQYGVRKHLSPVHFHIKPQYFYHSEYKFQKHTNLFQTHQVSDSAVVKTSSTRKGLMLEANVSWLLNVKSRRPQRGGNLHIRGVARHE